MRVPMLVVTSAVVAWYSSAVAAQEIPTVAPGARVRVWVPRSADTLVVGTLVEMRADTLFLQGNGQADTKRIPIVGVKRLDISVGRKSHAGTGAAAGFLIGGGGGALVGFLLGNAQNCDGGCGGLGALALGGVGAGSGLFIGAIVGNAIQTDRWQEVPMNRFRVGLLPQRNGRVAIAVSLSF